MDNFNKAINTARRDAQEDMDQEKIYHLADFFRYIDYLLHWVPSVPGERDELLHKLVVFYWVFDQPDVKGYQSKLDPDNTSGTPDIRVLLAG